jgi:hypothetical protein
MNLAPVPRHTSYSIPTSLLVKTCGNHIFVGSPVLADEVQYVDPASIFSATPRRLLGVAWCSYLHLEADHHMVCLKADTLVY